MEEKTNKKKNALNGGYVISPLNYTGGKGKLLPQILPLFPSDIDKFVDLFCGGCNVGINVPARMIVFNDVMEQLIGLYDKFSKTPTEEIIGHIEGRIAEYSLSETNSEGYLALRSYYNETRLPLDLFVLIAYSFNNQIRFNSKGGYNMPFGKDRSWFNDRMREKLNLFCKALHERNVRFTCNAFDKLDISKLGVNDFVYCDPPYLISTATYNTGWGEEEEKNLLALLKRLDDNGIRFGLSNVLIHKGRENTLLKEWVEENGFIVHHLAKDYANCSYHTINKDKSSTDEVLIVNYEKGEML